MKTHLSGQKLLDQPSFAELSEFVISATGLNYYREKQPELADRITKRMTILTIDSCAEYLKHLQNRLKNPPEMDALVTELTIGETYFFRHEEQFEALRKTVLPQIIERNKESRKLRIWSAGCSIGAEPYSLAILLEKHFGSALTNWDVKIVATDINRVFLDRAKQGVYDEWSLRSTGLETREKFFERVNKTWKINAALQSNVQFQYHNLMEDPFPSLMSTRGFFDIVICRNVMIYFSHDVIRKIARFFEQALAPAGWLIVGHAEPNVELFSPFEVIQEPSAILYRKPLPVSLNNTLPKPLLTPSLPAPLPFVAIIKTAKPKVPEKNFRELADLGEFEAALAACDRSIAKNKLNSVTYFYRALICEQMARYSDSERDLRQSIFLNPSFPLAHYYLGLCCLHKNDVDGALHSFANVQNLLANLDSNIVFNEGDGISAKELLELSHYHMINLRAA